MNITGKNLLLMRSALFLALDAINTKLGHMCATDLVLFSDEMYAERKAILNLAVRVERAIQKEEA